MNKIKKYINKLVSNTWLVYLLFINTLIFLTLIFCIIFVKKNPHLINEGWTYSIDRIGFDFSQIIANLLKGNDPVNNYYGIDFYISRMPFLPYFLFFTYSFISKNFIIIHLFKNILFGSLVFLTINYFNKKHNNYFLVLSLLFIFCVPHNLWISLSTVFEEGWLNYLIIILFFLLIGDYKHRAIYIGLVISLIFFLKGSMYYLALSIPIIYIFLEKKISRFVPLVFFLISSFSWGTYSYLKTGYFAFGFKSETLSTRTLAAAYTKGFFTEMYPKFSSDEMNEIVNNKVKQKKFKNEWEVNKFLLNESLEFIKNNPSDVAIGIVKKINLILFYPYKDGQIYKNFEEGDKSNIPNQIRLSNFPNKVVFLIALSILFKSLIINKNNNFQFKRVNIYYLSILIAYFFPYMIAFPFSRHCTSIYMISNIYLFLYFINKYKFKFLNKY
jgi:hypothetical protein